MKNIFWNSEEIRLKLFFRILFTLLVAVVLGRALTYLTKLLGEIVPSDPSFDSIVIALLITITLLIAAKFFDKRKFSDYGIKLNKICFTDFCFGLFLGTILIIFVFILEYIFGFIELSDTFYSNEYFLPELLYLLLGFIAVGYWEEVFMRGFLIKNFSEGFFSKKLDSKKSTVLAVVFTSIIFGAVHIGNPNYTILSLIGISLIGLLFAVSYIYTGSLGVAIGMHISWNFVQGPIFGFPVSGISTKTAKVFVINQFGADYLTGGKFGPEAGLIGIVSIILGFLILMIYLKKYHKKLSICKELAFYKNPE